LVVLDALRLRERIDAHVLEVPSEYLAAIRETGARNDKDQDPARLEPTVSVLKEKRAPCARSCLRRFQKS